MDKLIRLQALDSSDKGRLHVDMHVGDAGLKIFVEEWDKSFLMVREQVEDALFSDAGNLQALLKRKGFSIVVKSMDTPDSFPTDDKTRQG